MRLIDLCNNPEIELSTIAQIVAQDVALTGKVLSLANSAFLGSRLPFHDIDQAVVFLGSDTIRNMAVSTAVHDAFGNAQTSQQFNLKEFWYHSLFCALLAKELAEQAGYESPSRAYLTGLLHDLGKCLLAITLPQQYDQLNLQLPGDERARSEKQVFGISHPDAGLLQLTKWQLSPEIIATIRFHHHIAPEEFSGSILPTVLAVANLLAGGNPHSRFDLSRALAELQIEEGAVETLVGAQKELILNVAQSLGIEVHEPESKEEQRKREAGSRQTLTDSLKSHAQLLGALDNLLKANTVNRVYLAVEESLQLLFELDRSLILLPETTASCLQIHGSFRNAPARKLRSHTLVPADIPAVQSCLESMQSSTVPVDPADDTNPLHTIAAALAATHLFLQPFTVSATIKGILLLGIGSSPPSAHETFSETVRLLTIQLGHRLLLNRQERRYAEELANVRQYTQTNLARCLAQELAAPLATLNSHLNNCKTIPNQQIADNELMIVTQELDRINSIRDQLHQLSATPTQTTAEVALNQVLAESTQAFAADSGKQSPALRIFFAPDTTLPSVFTDAETVKQILRILLTNSYEAVSPQGTIRVSSTLKSTSQDSGKHEIGISVADNGPGIPDSVQPDFFLPGVSSKGKGHTGLGLAIARKLSNDLGGSISHRRLDGETVFTVHLPLHRQ